MKGDFTRDTFDQMRHFSRVLMQQGRVQLDADFNEQVSILLHYLRSLAADLGGRCWGPADGFRIDNLQDGDFTIGPGRYYVDGILCENDREEGEEDLKYSRQVALSGKTAPKVPANCYVYLDVWERHISHLQDDHIREVALGGPDTCTRSEVRWQVRIETRGGPFSCEKLQTWIETLPKLRNAKIKARVRPELEVATVCSIPPESRYRGAENQLYRIEIHRSGSAWNGETGQKGKPAGNAGKAATFKWSRDNGSVAFPIVRKRGGVVTLQSLGRDDRTNLKPGDWVEIMDDLIELGGDPGSMAQVDKVDPVEMTVTLKPPADAADAAGPGKDYDEDSRHHPLLRRWDHSAKEGLVLSQGAILVQESKDSEEGWIEVEDGIEVQFQLPSESQGSGHYRTGDYWLVPARAATGKLEWPPELNSDGTLARDEEGRELAKALPPSGIDHHYAPLAVIIGGKVQKDCRCVLAKRACV